MVIAGHQLKRGGVGGGRETIILFGVALKDVFQLHIRRNHDMCYRLQFVIYLSYVTTDEQKKLYQEVQ